MPAKKHTNICVSAYDGELDISYDCIGPEKCKYGLCIVMPPDGTEDCTYSKYGTCHFPSARCAAVENLRNRLTRELKHLKESA